MYVKAVVAVALGVALQQLAAQPSPPPVLPPPMPSLTNTFISNISMRTSPGPGIAQQGLREMGEREREERGERQRLTDRDRDRDRACREDDV
jgi:hypothetical protein